MTFFGLTLLGVSPADPSSRRLTSPPASPAPHCRSGDPWGRMCRFPPVLVMPVQFSLPLRWVQAGQTFPSYLKMLRNPPTTAAFVVPAAATAACCRCCCCFCATCRHCYFAFVVRNKSPSLRFVVSVVSLRCLCLCLVACLDHSWVSRSLESDLVFVRRVLAILSVSPVFGLRLYRAC